METKIRTLPDGLRVFTGHDYADANLRFALDLEPGNKATKKKLADTGKLSKKGKEPAPTTIGEEKTYNPFLRYDSPAIVKELKKRNPSLGDSSAAHFMELRKLRDEWK
jgi:hydroxyacylglutathione hydrolase